MPTDKGQTDAGAREPGVPIGVAKARKERANQSGRIVKGKNGNPDHAIGETIPEMRARVAREREEAEPTAFQRSMIGRLPGTGQDDASNTDTSGIGTLGFTPPATLRTEPSAPRATMPGGTSST